MTMREEIISKLQFVDISVLERVKKTLEKAELEAKYPDLPDTRVSRTAEEIAEFKQLLKELAEPMPKEDIKEFREAIKRRPFRADPIEFEP